MKVFSKPKTHYTTKTLYLGYYYPKNLPWSRQPNPDFDEFSEMIISLKSGNTNAIDAFLKLVEPHVPERVSIAVVPSHEAKANPSGIAVLARKLCAGERINATECLHRHTTITKSTHGGARTVQIHLASIDVRQPHLIEGRDVLLMDDVITTGSSIKACTQLLLESAGAKSVSRLVLGKTTRG